VGTERQKAELNLCSPPVWGITLDCYYQSFFDRCRFDTLAVGVNGEDASTLESNDDASKIWTKLGSTADWGAQCGGCSGVSRSPLPQSNHSAKLTQYPALACGISLSLLSVQQAVHRPRPWRVGWTWAGGQVKQPAATKISILSLRKQALPAPSRCCISSKSVNMNGFHPPNPLNRADEVDHVCEPLPR